MMKTIVTMTMCGMLLTAGATQGSMLPGSQKHEWPANAERHVVSIQREAGNAQERAMIKTAEAAPPDTGAWWVTSEGQPVFKSKVMVPNAVTGDAVAYYENRIKDYQHRTYTAYSEPQSKLSYKATVKHHDAFELLGRKFTNVHVVKLHLQFHSSFTEDATMGIEITKQRTVVLDAKGKILTIDGDNDDWGAQFAT